MLGDKSFKRRSLTQCRSVLSAQAIQPTLAVRLGAALFFQAGTGARNLLVKGSDRLARRFECEGDLSALSAESSHLLSNAGNFLLHTRPLALH